MSKFLGRYKSLNGGILMVQRRDLGVFTGLGYIVARICQVIFFRQRKVPEFSWADYTEYNNVTLQINKDLNFHAKEMRRLIKRLEDTDEVIKAEAKTINDDVHANYGFSEPFEMDTKILEPIGLNFVREKQEWKSILSNKLSGKGRKRASGRDDSNYMTDNSYDSDTMTSTYIPDDYKKYGINASVVDGDVTWYDSKRDQKKGQGKKKGGRNPRHDNQQPGESEEGWNARLDARSDGQDMNKWEFF